MKRGQPAKALRGFVVMVAAYLGWLLVFTGSGAAQTSKKDAPDIAIMGDSISTGAATHPALVYDSGRLWEVFSGQKDVTPNGGDIPGAERFGLSAGPLQPPVRLWPSSREYLGGLDWVFRNAIQALAHSFLNTEAYSWGYLVGSALGAPPQRIYIAAADGARMQDMNRQTDRLLGATGGHLPSKVFVFFTGNDLCAPALQFVTPEREFGERLRSSLAYLTLNGKPAPGGTDVYLLSYLSALQILHSREILDKEVNAFGTTMTCKEFRKVAAAPKIKTETDFASPEAEMFSWFMPPNPALYCPTLFGGGGLQKDSHVGALANRIRAYRKEQRDAVRAFNEDLAGGEFRFHFIESTGNLMFSGEDIAQDCFHLSATGQVRVADAVLEALGKGLSSPSTGT